MIFFKKRISIYSAKFPNDLFSFFSFTPMNATGQTIITAQTAFHHCTFQVITPHFVHHCTLKEALIPRDQIITLVMVLD